MANVVHTTVFSYREGGGNPCPVVLDADEYSTEEMQAMTKEFMFESAFLSKPQDHRCDAKVRYFVPLHEMEMCVHATIGSATVLVEKGLVENNTIYFETKFGPLRIDWERNAGQIDVAVEQFLPRYMEVNPSIEQVCRALRIQPDDLADFPILSVATSRQKLMVPLKNHEILDNLDPDFEYLWSLCDEFNTTGFYPFSADLQDASNPVFYARQFPKRAGYNEDAATGVAASGLGAYLAKTNFLPVQEGWNSFTILQGFAMGKPSIIYSEILIENGEIVRTRIKGNAVLD